jgi:hypothetical protein
MTEVISEKNKKISRLEESQRKAELIADRAITDL